MTGNRWSSDDINFLVNNYREIDIEEICKRLNKTRNSVIIKANRMKLTRRIVSSEENFLKLRECINEGMGLNETTHEFEGLFTKDQIMAKAHSFGLTFNKWSNKEISIFLDYYSTKSMEELLVLLPKRSQQF
ncbi:hypothetical protein [Neobacillus bataviensis]|uniref:hypothetical protein n=1 Tax=Neobacillus bataviensis TaxID=220685 RepID=UPI001CC0C7B8|nr:hypothetical protein [Neobacillus bataviensis]